MNTQSPLFAAAAIAVLIGAMLPLQGLINARLGQHVGGAVQAAFLSFLVGTLALGIWLLAARQGVHPAAAFRAPVWIWAGGLIGAAYVACFTLLVPRLGAASIICLAILGQLTASLLLDHHGVLQAPRAVDFWRMLGALLVLAGTLLVVAPWQSRDAAASAPSQDQSIGESSR